MRKPLPYGDADEVPLSTSLWDLVGSCRCPPRVEVLLSLVPGPLSVGAIADLLLYELPHVSAHLRLLRGAKLVTAEPRQKQRLYRLGPAVRAERSSVQTVLTLMSDDGCELVIRIPDSGPLHRSMAPALRSRLHSASTAGSGDAGVRVRPGGGERPSRRPSGR